MILIRKDTITISKVLMIQTQNYFLGNYLMKIDCLEDCKTNWDAFCHILSCYKSKYKPNSRVVIFKHPKN